MFTLIVTASGALAFVSAIVVFHIANSRGHGGLGVLGLAMAVALTVFGIGAATAWAVDTPRPASATDVCR